MKRIVGGMAAALMMLGVVAGCGGAKTEKPAAAPAAPAAPAAEQKKAPTKVTFRLDWKSGAQHAPFYLAKEKGFYAAEGIDLEIISGSGSSDSVKHLGTGSVDLALVDGLVVVQGKAQGVPLKAVSAYYQSSPISVITPKAKNINKPEDLIGKKMGAKKASATYQGMMVFLESQKIKPEQLQMIDVGFGVQPLLVNQVDALMGFTMNETVEAEMAGMQVHELKIADFGVKSYGLTIAANEKFAQAKPELVKGFLKATAQGMAEAKKEPKAAVEALAKAVAEVNKDREERVLVKAFPVWESDDTKANGYGWQNEAMWQATIDTAVKLKLVEKAPDVKTVYTNDLLKK